MKRAEKPLLGLATTRELLEELKARGELWAFHGRYVEENTTLTERTQVLLDDLPEEMLAYRPVDGS